MLICSDTAAKIRPAVCWSILAEATLFDVKAMMSTRKRTRATKVMTVNMSLMIEVMASYAAYRDHATIGPKLHGVVCP